MANIARVTQSVVEQVTLQSGAARVTQSVLEFVVGLGISCNTPPNGTIGTPYTHTFLAGSGEPPYAFAISAGTLPPGLTLAAATGIASGTPTTPGTFAFTVTVTDTFIQTASVNCVIVIPAAVPSTSPLAIPGGIPFAVQGCKPRNHFDWCMFMESLAYRKIKFPPLCAIPKEFRERYPLPWGEDFGENAIPPQAKPLHKIGSIATPTTIAGDTLVIQERVPTGYDGLLMGVFNNYTGQNFEQGSGDILWRLKLNQRYLKDFGSLPFALGSSVSPCPLTEGQILLSGQLMQWIVNVPNLSGNIQIGDSLIVCGLLGFYWPR